MRGAGGAWNLPFDPTTNFSLLGFFFDLFGLFGSSGDRKRIDLDLKD